MLTGIKTKLFRYCDLSWSSLVELKQWIKKSASFNAFDMNTFHNPSIKVAVATDEQGRAICYTPVESVFLVSAYAVSPQATEAVARTAGDYIDSMLAREAQKAGVSKVLIVLPAGCPAPEGEFRYVRVYERKVPQAIATGGIDCHTQSPTAYLN